MSYKSKPENIMIVALRPIRGGVQRSANFLIKNLLRIKTNNIILVSLDEEMGFFKTTLDSRANLRYVNLENTKNRHLPLNILKVTYKYLDKVSRRFKDRYTAKIQDTIASWIFLLNLKDLIKQYEPNTILDAWIGAAWPLYAPFPKKSPPYFIIIHDLRWFYKSDFTSAFRKHCLEKTMLNWLSKACHIFVPSDKVAREIKLFIPRHGKITTIPWAGLENTALDNNAASEIIVPVKNEHFIFYYPASMSKNKNHIILFKAMLILADKGFRFRVILSGDNTDLLIKRKFIVNKHANLTAYFYRKNREVLDKHTKTLGYCTTEEIDQIYKKCDCVLAISDYEGYGLPLVEASSNGLPVICSKIDAFQEQVDFINYNDMVAFFSPADAIGLASRMEQFIMGTRPLRTQKTTNWSWTHVAEKYNLELNSRVF